MRQSLLLVLLFCFGCTAKAPPSVDAASLGEAPSPCNETEDIHHWMPAIPAAVLGSPFLPALVRAGLNPDREHYHVGAIDCCGTIRVDEAAYIVLYIHREIWLTEYNQRGGGYWLICDTNLNPVWDNPSWGGTPGECFENHVRVRLYDKFFEVRDESGWGDFLTFRRDGSRLVASIGWESDEARIAQFLNWPKWRDDSNEPDEVVKQILPVAGHPDWRIVLTQYTCLYHQGCAHFIAVDNQTEFGCRSLPGIWSDQACRPVSAGTVRLPLTSGAIVWVNYETRSGYPRTHWALVSKAGCVAIPHVE